ncbi:MAG: DNA methyltransferase [Fidelibacterota bacterium]
MKLAYPGKTAGNQIARRTAPSVLEPVKTLGKIGLSGWHNRMIMGDNLPVLKTLLGYKEEGILTNGDGSSGVRLVYIDPPFGTGDVYDRDQVSIYSARLKGPRYLEWLRTRIVLLRDLVSEDGSFYLRTDYHFGHYVKVLLDELFGQENFRNEIIVRRTKKVFDGIHRFNSATDTLYFYSRNKQCVFNGFTRSRRKQKWVPMHSPGIRWTKVNAHYLPFYEENQLKARQDANIYSRGRVFEDRVWLPPEGRHWTFSQERLERYAHEGRIRVNSRTGILEYLTSAREILDSNWTDIPGYSFKWNFPSENSEDLLERVIGASSRPGDVVLDAFGGSGTTGAVAEKMGRRWIMIDSSRTSTYTVFRRMLQLRQGNGNRGKAIPPSPFAIYRARPGNGSDGRPRKKVPTEVYRQLIAELLGFEYRPFAHKGMEFVGRWKGCPVLMFNSELDRHRVREISEPLEGSFDCVLIVVPEGMVSFLEDVVTVNGTEFRILRVPHSVEEELLSEGGLRTESFEVQKSLKEIVDSARYEVNLPPDVSCRYRLESSKPGRGHQAVITIKDFRSQVRERAGVGALGMVALDRAPNGRVFRPDHVWSSEDLIREGYEVKFPVEASESTMLILFADRYGNERKEAKTIGDFQRS